MDFTGKIVIHKAWGKGTVSRYESNVLFICFGQEEIMNN